jgi:hypothetical protein
MGVHIYEQATVNKIIMIRGSFYPMTVDPMMKNIFSSLGKAGPSLPKVEARHEKIPSHHHRTGPFRFYPLQGGFGFHLEPPEAGQFMVLHHLSPHIPCHGLHQGDPLELFA